MTAHPQHPSITGARAGASRIGITLAEYLAHRANGELWCSSSKHWVPAKESYGTICVQCAAARQRRMRAAR